MQDLKSNPGKWNNLRVENTDPEKRQRTLNHRGDDGHNMVLVTRLDDNGNARKRTGYNDEGRYTYVDNTTYKCVDCGVETGTRPTAHTVECDH